MIYSSRFSTGKHHEIKEDFWNFRYLTGVRTELNAREFYQKALLGTVGIDDFLPFTKAERESIRRKIIALSSMDKFLLSENLFAEEDFFLIFFKSSKM
ncbi:hypothetical protein SAMN02745116_01716 [Pilibacter termitis]|uniref:Uncharacterized protein n=1 Tax=Pilibacter termitis TaxID=263852 RepID=A0A1T4P9T0_9ENTE|nr:hypothetical protein SAMN02745116_01716 [Pilibacter termitis]